MLWRKVPNKATMAFQKLDSAGQEHRGIKGLAVFRAILYDNQNVLDCGLFYTGSVTYSSLVLQSLKQSVLNNLNYRYFRIRSIYRKGMNGSSILKNNNNANVT